ncbi:PH domain-containing protein [Vairimorpha necatrix]|uniref:PH domain-containing protein n=1 Tax=Vairimorpha necatrix TaxID=6039 RepID=A0AAX4J7V1_9MICR
MQGDKSNDDNRRRKSIMVIDKKGNTKEVPKKDASASRIIDTTEKTKLEDLAKKSNESVQKLIHSGVSEKKESSESNVSNKPSEQEKTTSKVAAAGGIAQKSSDDPKASSNPFLQNKSSELEKSSLSNKPEKPNLSSLAAEKKNLNMRNAEIAAGATAAGAGAAATAGVVLNKSNESSKLSNKPSEQNKSNISNKPSEQNKSNISNKSGENDKSLVQNKSNNGRNAGIVAGATAGGAGAVAAGMALNNPKDDKKVSIDEKKNEEHSVQAEGNKSTPLTDKDKSDLKARNPSFVPLRIPNHDLHQDSEILKDREEGIVEAEGHMWKRRRIFACFWHEKYFILTKSGILRYHKANGTKKAKGNLELKNIDRIHEVFMGGDNHPFRLALMSENENYLFAFDDSDSREYWLGKLGKFINKKDP